MASQLLKRKYQRALVSAIGVQCKKLNLKPVNSVDITFDPFSEGAGPVREVSYIFSRLKLRKTNPECVIKTKVVCDRSEPTISVNLKNGQEVIYKASNLTLLDILEHFNWTVEQLLKPPENK